MGCRPIWGSATPRKINEGDWETALEGFGPAFGREARRFAIDGLFLEALHVFAVHGISRRALPERFERVAIRCEKPRQNLAAFSVLDAAFLSVKSVSIA